MNTLKVIVMIIQHSFVYEIMQLVLHGVLYLSIDFQLSKNTFFFRYFFFTFYLKKEIRVYVNAMKKRLKPFYGFFSSKF